MITIEPIYLEVELSVEEYELDYEETESLDFDLEMAINVNSIEGEHYQGTYLVDPNFATQTLETRNKVMDDDVTVNPIYVGQTTNVGGGYTVYIGTI